MIEPGAGSFVIETDASNQSIAGVLSQKSKDLATENLIKLAMSRALRPNEVNWDTAH